MSIEIAIAENTAALKELAAAVMLLVGRGGTGEPLRTADAKPTTAKEAIDQALAAARADKGKKETAAPTPAPAPEPESDPLGGDDEPVVLDWTKDVLPVLSKLQQKDKQAMTELLAKHDIGAGKTHKTAKAAPVELFPTLVAEANKLLGA